MADTNKIQFGFKNVYYSIITESENTITFGTPKPWKGARSLTLSPEGDTSNYYADDMVYFTTSSNAGYTGTLTMAKMTDDVLKDIFGYVETANGMLAEDANVLPKNFALLCEFNGDVNATRHVWYKCTPGRPSTDANTKEDTVTPDEATLDLTMASIEDDGGHAWVKAKCPNTSSAYATFFSTAPALPTISNG